MRIFAAIVDNVVDVVDVVVVVVVVVRNLKFCSRRKALTDRSSQPAPLTFAQPVRKRPFEPIPAPQRGGAWPELHLL